MAKASADGSKPYHHGDLKNALIKAGMDILERDGLPGLTLRAIAASVGVSHTAPKNHFGSLRGLNTAIATEGFERHAAYIRDGPDDSSDRRARMQAAAEGYVRFATAHPALFELMFSPNLCDQDDSDLQAAGRDSFSVLADVARGLVWSGGNGPDPQARTEAMLWSLVHGYAMLLLSNQLPFIMDGRPPFSIAEVLPGFAYEQGATRHLGAEPPRSTSIHNITRRLIIRRRRSAVHRECSMVSAMDS